MNDQRAKKSLVGGWSAAALLAMSLLGSPRCHAQAAPAKPDLKTPTLYVIGYSHLDTEWCWTYPQVINEFIPNTLRQNFALFEKYPDYVFNWTGANRYKFMKEYYPADYATLKKYVAEKRWNTTGSSLEEGDVDIPSEESIIRQVMYGNAFFRNEFGTTATDFMLPDCFGFPASLPSILAHSGIKGFSTQKLTWGSAVGVPFNVGTWEGPDGQSIFAALNTGDYTASLNDDQSRNPDWIKRIQQDGDTSGIYADYRTYGVGDRGGSVRDSDAANLEKLIRDGGPIKVIPARADEMFNDLKPEDKAALPHYKGDLLLTWHSAGSATSQAEQKRWNHENEKLADATERASVAADWLGALPYDKARIADAWWKFLPGQFHDLMAGTALPLAYVYAWNDQVLAMNEFAGQLQEAVGGVSRGLDTEGPGVPVVVYNPLSITRQDVVGASVVFPSAAPPSVHVVGPDGLVVPSQIESRSGGTLKMLFLATVPSVGYATYFVRPGASASAASGLKVTPDSLENARYRVMLDAAGDVASIYDKKAGRELLAAPMRLSFQYENPSQYPAWNMDYEDQTKPPVGYVDGPATVTVVENGPVRVALQIDRWARHSHFVQTIRLASGRAGDHVEFADSIDWKSQECALKAVLPLTVSNPMATYNWELGTIKRATNDPKKYEVPTHQWFDLTDTSGSYGVSVLTTDRYGSDKPDASTMRLTLLYTPGVRAGFHHQATQDFGHHDLLYGIAGHAGSWQSAGTQWSAMRLDKPLIAFQATAHPGALGRSASFVHLSNPSVSIEALKQAEASHEVIVRFNELAGTPQQGVHCAFAAPILSAREVDGQEHQVGPATVRNGALVFDMAAYRPRAFALTLAPPPSKLSAPQSQPLTLAYDANVEKAFGSAAGGSFDAKGDALPADMLPATLVSDGVRFKLASADAANNTVECKGQTLSLPSGSRRHLYFLAASDAGDTDAVFTVAGKPVIQRIQAWNGMVGEWDTRMWEGHVDELTYDQTNPMVGIQAGFVKRDPVAWYSDHIRATDGSNQPYQYCYLFRYEIAIPDGAKSVTLPDNGHVKILAATVATDPNQTLVAAQPLYDTLKHPASNAPHISTQAASDGGSVTVGIDPPLYYGSGSSLHYTLDGTEPTASSPRYTDPFTVTQSATVRAVYVDDAGAMQGIATAKAAVDHPTPPAVVSANAVTPNTVTVKFSEMVSKTSAENAANYSLSPAIGVTSANLASDDQTVSLQLAGTQPDHQQVTLAIHGVQSAIPGGLTIPDNTTIGIAGRNTAFESVDIRTFNGATDGVATQGVGALPTSGNAPWTINLFAYFDQTPGELTTLGGFGDDSDTNGTQRYILKFHDGIHFWASNVDVTTGVAYDLGKWQMVTATFDGKQLQLFKNGQSIKTAAISLNDAASVVKIAPPGPWPNGNRMNGKIAGFRIWNAALSPDQVAGLMTEMPK